MDPHPHAKLPVSAFGAAPEEATAAVVLVHGRGATAASILELGRHLVRRVEGSGGPDLSTVAWVAPQAAEQTWYPRSFLAPLADNQPYLDSALRRLGEVVGALLERGVPAERILLAGFSQGACLTSEWTARNARRWGGVAALTGGLIGPPGTPRDSGAGADLYTGSLDGTPTLFASGDPDPHIPWGRVEESADLYRALGAEVEVRRFPGMGHTVNDEELAWLAQRLAALVEG